MSDKIAVVGSYNTDWTMYVEKLPSKGETVLAKRFLVGSGGKGSNQAIAARRLGTKDVFFVGCIGNDEYGERALDLWKKEGVDSSFVKKSKEAKTGMALIIVDEDANNTITVYPGANDDLDKEFIERLKPIFSETRLLLLQLETPLPTVMHAASVAKSCGCTVVLNPAPPRPGYTAKMLSSVDVLVPNELEFAALFHGRTSEVSLKEEANRLTENSDLGALIVTLGSKGALVTTQKETFLEAPPRVESVIDTTGAGDAFCGALAVALCEGKSIRDATRFANCAAALKTTRRGAVSGVPRRSEVEELMDGLKI
jgi:ribokinase